MEDCGLSANHLGQLATEAHDVQAGSGAAGTEEYPLHLLLLAADDEYGQLGVAGDALRRGCQQEPG